MDRKRSIPRAQPKHHSIGGKSGRGKVSILHHVLFYKLLLKSVFFTHVLVYGVQYYGFNNVEECFSVLCGVKQGGVLSPY